MIRSVGSYFTVPRPVQLWEKDRLQTARGGRALLGLGSYLTLGLNEESEIEMVSTNINRPRIALTRGAAMISLNVIPFRSVFETFSVEIATPHARAIISEKGDFRIQIDTAGTTVTARSGQLQLSPREASSAKVKALLKSGQVAHLPVTSSPTPQISWPVNLPFDEFDAWWESSPRAIPATLRR